MKMIIIAGGRGERLRPITNFIPKPMIEVAGKPIIEHILIHAKKYGITEFIFSLCYLHKKISSYFGKGKKWGVNIKYTYERHDLPQGSAGAVLKAKKFINDTFIVTYGDILRDLNIGLMINEHKKNKPLATINIYKRYGKNPKSMIFFDQNSRVTDFKERPKKQDITDNYTWANGSFYIFEKGIFDYIAKDIFLDFGQNVFPKLLKANKLIFVYKSTNYFIDIGNLEKLRKARKTFHDSLKLG